LCPYFCSNFVKASYIFIILASRYLDKFVTKRRKNFPPLLLLGVVLYLVKCIMSVCEISLGIVKTKECNFMAHSVYTQFMLCVHNSHILSINAVVCERSRNVLFASLYKVFIHR